MRAPDIRTIPTADIEIPVELSRLYDLAYNLWWTWNPRAQMLFRAIDPEEWANSSNPVEVLINVDPQRWESLLLDDHFLAAYHSVVRELDRYLDEERTWFRQTHPDFEKGPVVYLCTEYGWHESLGVYSGGLGILAGDYCKAASDLGLPFVGVGLGYRRGYFRQTIDADGHQQHHYPRFDPRRLPLLPVVHPNGRRVRVTVDFPGRKVHLRLWKVTVGRVPVVLLDSYLRENRPEDRPITSILYVRGREMRLCQEYILGVGAVKVMHALGIRPSVWHVNEGHSALFALQRARDVVEREEVAFETAIGRIRRDAIFTTHTPVPAGNEAFDDDLIVKYFSGHAEACDIAPGDLLALGRSRPGEEDGSFNLTALAIRTTRSTNGVSELHGQVASAMWRHLGSATGDGGPSIGHVTNGVHVPSWLGLEIADLLRSHLGQDLEGRFREPGLAERIAAIPDDPFWEAHLAQKRLLLKFTRRLLLSQFARHGHPPDELAQVEHLLDPETLTIGFARRFATYKRAALLFRDQERLKTILTDVDRPVQILFAGKAHPADRPGQELIQRIFRSSRSPEFQGHIVFLEDYDIHVARHLVQGVDLWLNTPLRPHEASGTSGMKAAINGGLHFSVMDGWWCEGYDPSYGWVIGKAREYEDPEAQDRDDAESLYQILAEEIAPCFYDREAVSGRPRRWIDRMKKSMAATLARFSASRMVGEYADVYYWPARTPDEGHLVRDRTDRRDGAAREAPTG